MIRNICSAIFGIVSMLGVIALTGWLLLVVGQVNAWEKSHGYPYGRMCDANIFNLYQSTCR